MNYRGMGSSGLRLSEVGLGTNQFGGVVDAAGAAAILERALDLGINHIDTAESYNAGRSEELIGRALKSRRHEAVLASKTGSIAEPPGRLSRRSIMQGVEASLRRLQTDHLDIYYLHFPDPATPLEESLGALDDLVAAGKVLYPALSNHPAWQVAEALGICDRRGLAKPVVTQNQLNLIDRAALADVLPAAAHFGLGVVPYYPLAAGFLTGKYRRGEDPPSGVRGHGNERFAKQWLKDENFATLERVTGVAARVGRAPSEVAIAWLLTRPEVCSVIVGATSAEQVEANARAAEWTLSPEDAAAL